MINKLIKTFLLGSLVTLNFSFTETDLSQSADLVAYDYDRTECLFERLQENHYLVDLPKQEVIQLAFKGHEKLRKEGKLTKSEILTVIDFSLPSTEKRMWVLDIDKGVILINTFVAHGQNTGQNYAEKFSNKPESHCSSLGFYVTGETYHGKHGLSLFLDGQETGVNDNARSRYVVIHGAEYVSESFIKNTGRLGRSFGCPAVPNELSAEIINTIKDKSCLFIYHLDKEYFRQSSIL